MPFVEHGDGSGLVDFHKTLVKMKEEDMKNFYANKEGWIKRVLVIGDIAEAEYEALHKSSRQAHSSPSSRCPVTLELDGSSDPVSLNIAARGCTTR